MKKLKAEKIIEPTFEEELEADEYHLDVELYEKFELPIFIEEVQLYVPLTPEQVLKTLDIMFWHGLVIKTVTIPVARFKPEIAMLLDKAVDEKQLTRQEVADALALQYYEAYMEKGNGNDN